MMLNLVIDTGNSSSKIALFDHRQLIKSRHYPHLQTTDLDEFVDGYAVTRSIRSSVLPAQPGVEEYLRTKFAHVAFHTGLTAGVTIHYRTPETLGPDRLAAVIGATALFPGRDVLVIDAGTCITYDLADARRHYYGGNISPGIKMRLAAMHTFTGKLPLISVDENTGEKWGADTRSAMLLGAKTGALHEVSGFIAAARDRYPELLVVLCGGDVNFFETHLKSSIFAHALKTEPDLVLIGLNEVILNTND